MRIVTLIILLLLLNSCKHQDYSFTHNNYHSNKTAIITSYSKERMNYCGGKKKIVLIGGCFDLLHYGHLEYLRASKQLGYYLIVALESDEHIMKYKHRTSVHNQQQRAANLSAIRYVDHVLMLPMLSGYSDYFELVKNTCPDVIAVTEGDPQLDNIKKQAKNIGAVVQVVTKHLGGFSTTNILDKTSKQK